MTCACWIVLPSCMRKTLSLSVDSKSLLKMRGHPDWMSSSGLRNTANPFAALSLQLSPLLMWELKFCWRTDPVSAGGSLKFHLFSICISISSDVCVAVSYCAFCTESESGFFLLHENHGLTSCLSSVSPPRSPSPLEPAGSVLLHLYHRATGPREVGGVSAQQLQAHPEPG